MKRKLQGPSVAQYLDTDLESWTYSSVNLQECLIFIFLKTITTVCGISHRLKKPPWMPLVPIDFFFFVLSVVAE